VEGLVEIRCTAARSVIELETDDVGERWLPLVKTRGLGR
jgi:hypothetical protein